MKKLLFSLLSALFLAPSLLLAQELSWQKMHQFNGLLQKVYFTDVDNGFVSVGSVPGGKRAPAAVYRTHDGGKNWSEVFVEGLNHQGHGIQDIVLVDDLNGWACGHSDMGYCLWKTTDGGNNWVAIPAIMEDIATNVKVTAAGLLVSGFDSQKIRRSVDGGKTFTTVFEPPLNDNLLGMDFSDEMHGVVNACYRAGNPWYYTADGGLTWSPTATCMESWSMYAEKGSSRFYVSPEGFSNVLGYKTDIYRSDDFGQTWKIVHHFDDLQMNGHMAGVGETLYIQTECTDCPESGAYRSTDHGVNWTWLGGDHTGYGDTRFGVIPGICHNVLYYGGSDFALYKAFDSVGVSKGEVTIGVFPVSQVNATVNPGDTAGVEILTTYPAASPVIGTTPEEITYTISFDSKVVVCQGIASVIPPSGWTVNSVSFTTTGIEVTLANPSKMAITLNQGFGRVIFTVLTNAPNPSSNVLLDKIIFKDGCATYTAISSVETGFLKRIVVGSNAVPTAPTAEIPSLFVRPNPASASAILSFEAMKDRPSNISIIDITGKICYSDEIAAQPSGEYSVSLAKIPSGSYTIIIETAATRASAKIEIVK